MTPCANESDGDQPNSDSAAPSLGHPSPARNERIGRGAGGEGWLWAPLVALQFLTRIPIKGVPAWAYKHTDKAFALNPLVGVVVGAIGAGALVLLRYIHCPAIACAVLAVAATAVVTGAMHEDGLADVADGFGPHDRAAALAAMRDSRLGAFGVIALWCLLTLKGVALANLATERVFSVMIAAHVLARWSALPIALFLPYVQPTDQAARNFSRSINAKTLVIGTAIAMILLVTVTRSPMAALGYLFFAAIGTFAVAIVLRTKFGGYTGDGLGSANQVIEVVCLYCWPHIPLH